MTWEYLPPGLLTEPDSGTDGLGQKACLDRYQFDYTCGIVDTSFDAPVDVIAPSKLGKGG